MKSQKLKLAALKAAAKLKSGEIGIEEYAKFMLEIPEVKFKNTPPVLPLITK